MRGARKSFTYCILIIGIFTLFISGCTTQFGSKSQKECEPIVIKIIDTEGLVINGIKESLVGDYRNLQNVWVNIKNPKEYIVIITEKDFVWLRVDEDDYGYLYGGEYENDETSIHLVVYANNEIIEEYTYEYWIEKGWQNTLYLKDESGEVIEYIEMPNWDSSYYSTGD